jgi:hypothetical protein
MSLMCIWGSTQIPHDENKRRQNDDDDDIILSPLVRGPEPEEIDTSESDEDIAAPGAGHGAGCRPTDIADGIGDRDIADGIGDRDIVGEPCTQLRCSLTQ